MSTNQKDISRRSGTFRSLYYWGKFLGINPLNLSQNNELEFSYLSLFYACLLGATFSYSYYQIFVERISVTLPDEAPISVIVDSIQIVNVGVEISLTWLMNGFFQNRLKRIFESFAKAEKTSRRLGIPEDYEQHFRKLGFYLMFANGSFIFLIILNNIELSHVATYNPFVWTIYHCLRLCPLNSVTTFIWYVTIIERKFHRLNKKVCFLVLENYEKPHVLEDNLSSRRINSFSYDSSNLLNTIDLISQQRRELINVLDCVKGHFDLLLLFCIMSHVPSGILNACLAYKSLKENEPMTYEDWMYTNSYLCWLFVPLFKLSLISNVCGSTINEANETGSILHGVLNGCQYASQSREIVKFEMFSFELLQNPVKFSLFGLIELDRGMVYRVLVAAITYFVIMLQFYNY